MKTIIICTLILCCNNLFSQSKKDTEAWIESKIELHAPNAMLSYNYDVKFSNCTMEVREEIQYEGLEAINDYKIPIADLQGITFKSTDKLVVVTFTTINSKKTISHHDHYLNITGKDNKIQFKLAKTYEQENLIDRTTKAFNHLINLCSGKVVDETF